MVASGTRGIRNTPLAALVSVPSRVVSGDWTVESCCGGVDSVVSGLGCGGGDGSLEGDPFCMSSIFPLRENF